MKIPTKSGTKMTVSDVTTEPLLTLATSTGILEASPVMTRGGKALSLRGCVAIHALTPGDGPFLFGILEKGVSLAQLEAYLENAGPVSPDVVGKAEVQSRGRILRTLGVLQPEADGSTASLFFENTSLKGLAFSEENAGWSWWLYNLGSAMTTGALWRNALQVFVEFNPSG